MIKNMELCPRKIKTKILKIKSKYFSRLSLNERFGNFIVINDVKNNALAGVGRPMNEENLGSLMLNFASLIDETIKIITELYFNIE